MNKLSVLEIAGALAVAALLIAWTLGGYRRERERCLSILRKWRKKMISSFCTSRKGDFSKRRRLLGGVLPEIGRSIVSECGNKQAESDPPGCVWEAFTAGEGRTRRKSSGRMLHYAPAPNKTVAPNPAIAPPFPVEHHGRRAGDPCR
jgi:hypothetical protein